MQRFRAHGKLLLTGEYAVLDGALALALPTRVGQSLEVERYDGDDLSWKSLDPDGSVWFEGLFSPSDSGTIEFQGDSQYKSIGKRLAEILSTAQGLRIVGQEFPFGHAVTTHLEFSRNWGLGSSSTLVHNIAQWLEVDPYALLFKTLGGSGYDVACAAADGPILYQLKNQIPTTTRVNFDPSFKDDLCFVHLGQKQKSSEAIEHFRKIGHEKSAFIDAISELTTAIHESRDLVTFEKLLSEHEEVMSHVLQLPKVQSRFKDYPGVLKSLGAWGGDFILATRSDVAKTYFKKKGLTPVIPFSDLIL